MRKWLKGLAVAAVAGVLVLAGAAFALQHWLHGDDFRRRVEQEGSALLGAPLQLGRLSIDLWPVPAVAVDQVRIRTSPALTLERVEARPRWPALLRGELQVATLVVRKAVLPQASIAAIGAALRKKDPVAAQKARAPQAGQPLVLPRRIVLDDITWIDARGRRITLDAKADLGENGLLESASFQVLQGRFAGTRGEIARAGTQWPVRIAMGGGRITGQLQLRPGQAAGTQLLTGQLDTENVEVAQLTAPSRPLTGKLQAQTSLRAEYREPGQIGEVLQTQTRFTVRSAVLQGLDLARAVQTVGLSRGGSTRLETLAGQVSTRGKAVQVSNLVATSGTLTATGSVAISPTQALSGRISVDVAASGNRYAVPLSVGGTLDNPSVNLTSAAIAGAAIGAAANGLGERLRGWFGRRAD